MVDFPDSSMFPIQPVSRANEDRYDSELKQKRPRAVRKPEKVEEVEDSESDEHEHSLDLDA